MSVKVSVVIPVYNVAPYLTKCMESVSGQTLHDIEIIAVNDASTDNSLAILKKFAKHDSRIKIINHKKNTKTAGCRNDGLDAATGEYVCFLDGDDYLDDDFCEKLYKLAISEKADIAKGVTKTFNTEGTVTVADDNKKIISDGKYAFMGHLLTGLYNRKKLLLKNNIRFHIDFFCFQIQAVYFANKIVCDNTAFYNYVRHPNSCDSETFTIEKWARLNLGHANFMYDWINSHNYSDDARELYLERIHGLYFYGFNKLAKSDIIKGCEILSENMLQNYNCRYDCSDIKNLKRRLYKSHPKTTKFEYFMNIIRHRI